MKDIKTLNSKPITPTVYKLLQHINQTLLSNSELNELISVLNKCKKARKH